MPHPFIYLLTVATWRLLWQSWGNVTETVWFAKAKIIIWFLTKFSDPCHGLKKCHKFERLKLNA